MMYTSKTSKVETAKCSVCGREFYKYKQPYKYSKLNVRIRKSNSFTCSSACSKIRNRKMQGGHKK